VDDAHVVGEIGEVFAGRLAGRQSTDQITIYKSLGHVVQDLAATAYTHQRAQQQKAFA
jgi:ornithine cyclodeaminase